MSKELADKYDAARQTFEEADEALGYDFGLCFEGPEGSSRANGNYPARNPDRIGRGLASPARERRESQLCRRTQPEMLHHVAAGTLIFSDAVRSRSA